MVASFAAQEALSAALVSAGMPDENGRDLVIHKRADGGVHIHGSLDDFDEVDWPNVLAWFATSAEASAHAELRFEIEGGPRFHYVWDDGSMNGAARTRR